MELNFATAWSSNMVSICQATGLHTVTRVERSRRYLVPDTMDPQAFADERHDRMTECPYPVPLTTFDPDHPYYLAEYDLPDRGCGVASVGHLGFRCS